MGVVIVFSIIQINKIHNSLKLNNFCFHFLQRKSVEAANVVLV